MLSAKDIANLVILVYIKHRNILTTFVVFKYTQDIISILDVFSCRLYRPRKYKKKIEEDEEIAKSIQSGIKANQATDAENKSVFRHL